MAACLVRLGTPTQGLGEWARTGGEVEGCRAQERGPCNCRWTGADAGRVGPYSRPMPKCFSFSS